MGNTPKINDLNLWREVFGEHSDSVVLLIMGAYMNSQPWPVQLIQYSVNHRMRVICFDNRDSGKSTWFGKESWIEKAASLLPTSLLRPILKKELAKNLLETQPYFRSPGSLRSL